jgi:hypothetical protein
MSVVRSLLVEIADMARTAHFGRKLPMAGMGVGGL